MKIYSYFCPFYCEQDFQIICKNIYTEEMVAQKDKIVDKECILNQKENLKAKLWEVSPSKAVS